MLMVWKHAAFIIIAMYLFVRDWLDVFLEPTQMTSIVNENCLWFKTSHSSNANVRGIYA